MNIYMDLGGNGYKTCKGLIMQQPMRLIRLEQ